MARTWVVRHLFLSVISSYILCIFCLSVVGALYFSSFLASSHTHRFMVLSMLYMIWATLCAQYLYLCMHVCVWVCIPVNTLNTVGNLARPMFGISIISLRIAHVWNRVYCMFSISRSLFIKIGIVLLCLCWLWIEIGRCSVKYGFRLCVFFLFDLGFLCYVALPNWHRVCDKRSSSISINIMPATRLTAHKIFWCLQYKREKLNGWLSYTYSFTRIQIELSI